MVQCCVNLTSASWELFIWCTNKPTLLLAMSASAYDIIFYITSQSKSWKHWGSHEVVTTQVRAIWSAILVRWYISHCAVGILRPHSQARFPGTWSQWAYLDHTVKPDFLGYDHSGHTSTTQLSQIYFLEHDHSGHISTTQSSQISWDMITVGHTWTTQSSQISWDMIIVDHIISTTVKSNFLGYDHSVHTSTTQSSQISWDMITVGHTWTTRSNQVSQDMLTVAYLHHSHVRFPGIWSSTNYYTQQLKQTQASWKYSFIIMIMNHMECSIHLSWTNGMFHLPIMYHMECSIHLSWTTWNVPFLYHEPHGMFHSFIMNNMEYSIPLSWTTWNVPFLYVELFTFSWSWFMADNHKQPWSL